MANARKLLATMDAFVTWKAFIDLVVPHEPKKSIKNGRPGYPLTTVMRVYWF